MADYIFKTLQVTRGTLYSQVKSILTSNGWTNVSSSTASDFDVFQSNGVDGTRKLTFQIRDTDLNNLNPVSTTNNGMEFTARLVESYAPGANGAAGTFGKNPAWQTVPVIDNNVSFPPSQPLTLWYYCDANGIAFVVDPPQALNILACANYIGMPNESYCTEGASTGVIIATSGNATQLINGNNLVACTDAPADLPSLTGNETLTTYGNFNPTFAVPDAGMHYIPFEVMIGSSTEGWRFKLPALYILPNTVSPPLLYGDTIQVPNSTRVYKVFRVRTYSYWFASPSSWVAIQVSA